MLMIDRRAREELREELAATLTCARDLELYLDGRELDAGFASLRRRLAVTLHLLDDLGWQDEDRDVYWITAPAAEVRWWARERLEGVEESLRDCAACFAQAGPGERPSASPGEVALVRERADAELDLFGVLEQLLERLDREASR